ERPDDVVDRHVLESTFPEELDRVGEELSSQPVLLLCPQTHLRLPFPWLRHRPGLRSYPTHHQCRVVPTEGEGVTEGRPDLVTTAGVRHVIEVALGVGRIVVQRRGNDSSTCGETAD